MSGMSGMLSIPLDRDAPPPHEPNERGNGRSGRHHPERLFPLHLRHCARSVKWHGGMPRMSLMPLMRSTPGFWMAARRHGTGIRDHPDGDWPSFGRTANPSPAGSDDTSSPVSRLPSPVARFPSSSPE
jgi:hypothetical protein